MANTLIQYRDSNGLLKAEVACERHVAHVLQNLGSTESTRQVGHLPCDTCDGIVPPPPSERWAGSADPGMPPPDVMEAFAKDCHCCRECSSPPCDEVMAAGVCPRRCSCDEDEYGDRCTDPDGHEWYEGAPDRMDEGPIRCIHCGADGDA